MPPAEKTLYLETAELKLCKNFQIPTNAVLKDSFGFFFIQSTSLRWRTLPCCEPVSSKTGGVGSWVTLIIFSAIKCQTLSLKTETLACHCLKTIKTASRWGRHPSQPWICEQFNIFQFHILSPIIPTNAKHLPWVLSHSDRGGRVPDTGTPKEAWEPRIACVLSNREQLTFQQKCIYASETSQVTYETQAACHSKGLKWNKCYPLLTI